MAVVLVNGMPGTGKTWLARQLAPALGHPLLARDAIKESLWDAMPRPAGVDAYAWSRRLGGVAFDVFWDLVPALGADAVLDVHLQPAWAERRRHLLPPATIEVFLTAEAGVIHRRYHERQAERHACHQHHPLPDRHEVVAELREWQPLALGGPLLEVDSTAGVDVDAVLAWLRAAR